MTEEHKRNISIALKGRAHSEEHNRKVSEALKGKIMSSETKKKISNTKTGKKQTQEHIEKCRLLRVGKKYKSMTKEARESVSKAQKKRFQTQDVWNKGIKYLAITGDKNPNWNKDRTPMLEKQRLRSSFEWKGWRTSVFERDGYTCQECKNRGGKLEPHHIIPLRTDVSKAFEIDNGITLCRKCHQRTIRREEKFIDKYSHLVKEGG